MKARHLLSAAMVAMGMGFGAAQAATYTLDFSGNICGASGDLACANNSSIASNYGSLDGLLDVSYKTIFTATNQVDRDHLFYWESGYSDLIGAAWAGTGRDSHYVEITFAPSTGHIVTLDSVDFGDYLNNNSGSSVVVLDAVTREELWDGHGFDSGPQASHLIADVSSANGLILQWRADTYYVGIDNIRYSVTAVPEPESLALAAAGLLVTGLAARRQRRQG